LISKSQEVDIGTSKRNPYPKGILLLGILPNNGIPFDFEYGGVDLLKIKKKKAGIPH